MYNNDLLQYKGKVYNNDLLQYKGEQTGQTILANICLLEGVFSTTFNNIFKLYRGGQFYWWRKLEDTEKTTDLSQVTDKL